MSSPRSTRTKDVDGLHPLNSGRLFLGKPLHVPATPLGVMVMLAEYGIELEGKDAVVVGRSELAGKPMAMLLLAENATVTICHSRTADLASHTRRADVLVAAIGRPGMITPDMVKPGAVVVDIGVTRTDEGVRGDVDRGRRRGRGVHDARSRRRRPDDDRNASSQHPHSCATSRRRGCGARLIGATVRAL